MTPAASPDAPAWCAVAASQDLAPGSVMPVMLAGRPVALWRAEGGTAHAWTDRCPHRGMRLSLGAVAARGLICPYHGWRFGEDRHCNFTPAHPQTPPPRAAAPQAHAVQERYGWVWVQPQASAAAAPALPALPDTLDPIRSLLVQAGTRQIAQAFAALCTTPATPEAAAVLRGHWPDGTQTDADVVLLLQPAAPDQHMLHLASVAPLALPRRQALNRRLVALRDTLHGARPLEAIR